MTTMPLAMTKFTCEAGATSPLSSKHQARARDANDLELASRGIGCRLEHARNLVQHLGVRIVGAGGRLADDATRTDEARKRVDMAVGVVVQETSVDPENAFGAERLAERGFGLGLGPAIAVLVEQSLPRGEDRAVAVLLDGAALEDEIEFAHRHAGKLGDVVADGRVLGQIELAAPTVGHESQGHRAAFAAGKDRPGVAQPDVAVTRRHNLRRVAKRGPSRALGLIARNQELHPVRRAERAHQRRHLSAGRRQVVAPLVRIGGPGRPHRLLRRPFGGNGNVLGDGNLHEFLLVVAPATGGLGENVKSSSLPRM